MIWQECRIDSLVPRLSPLPAHTRKHIVGEEVMFVFPVICLLALDGESFGLGMELGYMYMYICFVCFISLC